MTSGHERQECNASTTRTTQVQHEQDTSSTRVRHNAKDMSATQMKNFDFDKDKSGNIFSHPYIDYIANKRLQGEEQFHFKNYLLETPLFMPKCI